MLARILAVMLATGGPALAGDADWVNPLAARLEALGAFPCADSAMTCLTLDLPLDHRAKDGDRTIAVTFAVSLATEESAGILLYAVGGPGLSGLQVGEGYLGGNAPETVARLDVIFFDQRGIGASRGLDCPRALGIFDTTDLLPDEAAIATAQTFVQECLTEMTHADLLAFVGTDQAIRDAEAFRQLLGDARIWVYGESYGTQFAQEYATAFAQALRGVILDGTIDLTLSMEGFYGSHALAAERILDRAFSECDALPACAADMGQPAAAVYDALAASLRAAPAAVALPLGSGQIATRHLNAGMLETSAFYGLCSPDDRVRFLRALAAAGRGDWVPMLRLSYADLGISSQTGAGRADPAWFGAAYYAVTCRDYGGGQGDPLADARAVIAEAQAWPAAHRMPRAYFAERLVCALWPHRGGPDRPAPFTGGDWPTLVLTSDSDPITPATQAYAVFEAVQNATLILMQGGPHVLFGREHPCPDGIVERLLTDGVLPEAEVLLCEQDFLGGYDPLTLTNPATADPLSLARGVEQELASYPELRDWDAAASLTLGCNHGGTMSASIDETGTRYTFAGCALWPGLVVDGQGRALDADDAADGFRLELLVSGLHSGQIAYARGAASGATLIAGIWNGAPIRPPRP